MPEKDEAYKFGSPQLSERERAKLKYKVNPRDIEKRRGQERQNSVSKAVDRIQEQLKKRRQGGV